MDWIVQTFRSSIGRKVIMALTGLFMCTFLVVHLIGNLQLLKDDGGQAFNVYAQFMTSNPLIKIISYGNYAIILLHVFDGLFLTLQNRSARPVAYAYAEPKVGASWSSRNMGILGTLILVFLIIHMKNFWYEMHFGSLPMATYEGKEYKDLFKIVLFAFQNPIYVGFYVLSMVAIGFHLIHGFASAFQSLGLHHSKYNELIKIVGYGFAVLIPILYALIPVYSMLRG
jgi:succinate dehydrogenase / fumarate reductase, cytochrome b subunit